MKDVQNTQDTRNVDIQKVGIKNVELPLIIQRKNASDKVVYVLNSDLNALKMLYDYG